VVVEHKDLETLHPAILKDQEEMVVLVVERIHLILVFLFQQLVGQELVILVEQMAVLHQQTVGEIMGVQEDHHQLLAEVVEVLLKLDNLLELVALV